MRLIHNELAQVSDGLLDLLHAETRARSDGQRNTAEALSDLLQTQFGAAAVWCAYEATAATNSRRLPLSEAECGTGIGLHENSLAL